MYTQHPNHQQKTHAHRASYHSFTQYMHAACERRTYALHALRAQVTDRKTTQNTHAHCVRYHSYALRKTYIPLELPQPLAGCSLRRLLLAATAALRHSVASCAAAASCFFFSVSQRRLSAFLLLQFIRASRRLPVDCLFFVFYCHSWSTP